MPRWHSTSRRDDFQLMLVLTLMALPLLLLVRSARASGAPVQHAAME
jgi:hypothetical protein